MYPKSSWYSLKGQLSREHFSSSSVVLLRKCVLPGVRITPVSFYYNKVQKVSGTFSGCSKISAHTWSVKEEDIWFPQLYVMAHRPLLNVSLLYAKHVDIDSVTLSNLA